MRRKRSLRELETLGEFVASGLETADEIGGPITQCIAYKATSKKRKDGKPVMRCAKFYPTKGELEQDVKKQYIVSPEYKPTRVRKTKKTKKK